MSEKFCTYAGDREGALVAYLYGEIDPTDRKAFESHVATCDVCSMELTGLKTVRARLDQWAPPEPARALTGEMSSGVDRRSRRVNGWSDLPVWMQAVAATLLLGVAAGAANVHLTYNQDGLSVRTGWLGPAPEKSEVPAIANPPEPGVSRAELSALEQTLRAEIGAANTASPAVLRQVHALVADSDQRHQTELALRIAALYRDIQAQRTADLGKIERNLYALSSTTGLEVRRQNESIRVLQTRFSQKP